MRWTFTIDGVPGTKERPRKGAGGRIYTPSGTVAYERLVAGLAVMAGVCVGDGVCDVAIGVWLPDRRRKDTDNVAKVVLDGLVRAGRAALADDSFTHVRSLHVYVAGYDKSRPRVDVLVALVEDHGQAFPVCVPGMAPWESVV